MEKKEKVYFPGLNALRFFAATLVIFHHMQQYRFWAGYENHWGNTLIDGLGHKPVSFFFVLSGFLITYLLLVEDQRKGAIHIGRFYVRRLMRIWPLYFMIVFFALLIVPQLGYIAFPGIATNYSATAIFYLLFFLPNLLRVFSPQLIGGNQLWSVGVEEQFYLVWPVLVKRFVKNMVPFLLIFIAIKFTVHCILVGVNTWFDIPWLIGIEKLYALFPVEQMAIGGLGAVFLFQKKESMINYIHDEARTFLAFLIAIAGFVTDLHFVGLTYIEAYAYTIIIMQVINSKRLRPVLEHRFLNYMGNISYGIYMWHTLVIAFSMTLLKRFGLDETSYFNALLYVLALGGTLLVSHLSYRFFERPFLKLKDKFSFESLRGKQPAIQ